MFVRFQFKSTTFAELVRDQIARSDVGCIPPTGSGFVVERIVFPRAGSQPMDVDRSGDVIVGTLGFADGDVDVDVGLPEGRPPFAAGTTALGEAEVETATATATVLGTDPVVLAAVEDARIRVPRPGQVLDSPYETITVPVVGRSPISVRRRKILLTLPVTLSIRSLDNMIANTGEPLVITIDIRLRVNLVHRDDGKDYVRVAFGGVGHREGNDPAIEGLIRAELAGTDIAREVEFSYTESVLKAVAAMGGGEVPEVAWSGMTLSPDRQAVEMRVEVTFGNATGTVLPDEWQRFLTRQIDDFRTGHDWAVEITRDLLDVTATAGAHDEVSNQDGFDLAGNGPFVDWRPDYPGFRTRFTGEIIDACSCFGVDIDLNVSVEVTTRLRLVRAGRNPLIEVDTVAEGDATHAGEQVCCGVTAAMLFPILGWRYLAEGKIGWGGLALGMFVPVIGGFVTMWKLFDPSPKVPVPEDCRKDGDHQICTYGLDLNPPVDPCDPPSSSISLDALRGRNNGLVLAGAVRQTYGNAPQVVASRPTAFEWRGPKPTCNGPVGEWSARSDFTVTQVGGGFPLEVCEAIAVGPTAAIYRPHLWRTTRCPSTGHFAVSTVPWTPGNPDPAPILVLTNVGATVVMVPTLPPLEPELNAYEQFFARWRQANCSIYDPTRLSNGGTVASSWLVEPSPDDEPTRRLWVIRAGGLHEEEQLVVSELDGGEVLATGQSDARRGVRLDLLHDGDRLLINRRRADGSHGGPIDAADMSIAQLLLEQIDVHELGEPAEGLRATGPPHRAVIEVDLAGGPAEVRLRPGGSMARADRRGWPAPAMTRPQEAIRSARTAAMRDRAPSDQVRELAAGLRTRGAAYGDGPPVRIAPTSNSWRWIAHGGPDGFVEIDQRAARVTNRYRDRPWFDGMVYTGEIWARLDDDRMTLRTYRVRDSVVL